LYLVKVVVHDVVECDEGLRGEEAIIHIYMYVQGMVVCGYYVLAWAGRDCLVVYTCTYRKGSEKPKSMVGVSPQAFGFFCQLPPSWRCERRVTLGRDVIGERRTSTSSSSAAGILLEDEQSMGGEGTGN